MAVGERTSDIDVGPLPNGTSERRIYVPDIRDKAEVEFRLLSGDTVLARRSVSWQPQRHWTVHLCQIAHFDAGYTDLPSNVMREYLSFLDDVVSWCEDTEKWPEGSRFHYTIEQAWVAVHYVENRSPQQVERFARCCRRGQIEVNALYANMTSELMGPEQMARLMYPAYRLKRRCGVPIRTAEHNDVPGMSWGYATILTDAGIRILIPGLPDYFREGGKYRRNFADGVIQPRDRPEAFYWEAQNGGKVLVYLHRQGAGGDHDANLADLPDQLRALDREGYPYDTFRYVLIGGVRDNAPPLFDYARTVRSWNEKWAYPRYLLSTNYGFYGGLAKELDDAVPVHRGDYPGTDYPLGAISTAADAGANRTAKGFLLMGERLATIASEITGSGYPRELLQKAYDETLRHDEHTWGLSTPVGWAADAHRWEKGLYAYRAAALGEDVLAKSANRIADEIKLTADAYHIVVFNPLHYPRTGAIEVPFSASRPCGMPLHRVDPPPGDPHAPVWRNGTAIGRRMHALPVELLHSPFEVVDLATDRSVPHQIDRIPDAAYPVRFAAGRHFLSDVELRSPYTLRLIASDVPAVGYRTYRIVIKSGGDRAPNELRFDADFLENRFFRLNIDPRSGGMASLFDKELGRDLVDAEAAYAAGQLFCRTAKESRVDTLRNVSTRKGVYGPVAASVVISGELPGAPQCSQEVVLYRDIKRVEFNTRILKDADGTRKYYVAFPFHLENPAFRFDGPLNVIRPVEDQLPGTTTDYYAAWSCVEVRESSGSAAVTWSAREAPMVQLGENWPDYVSPAHHGVKPHDFDHEFLRDSGGFKKAHVYSYLATNNFCTNFAVSQPGVIFSSYALTTRQDPTPEESLRFSWGFCNPMVHAILPGRQSGPLPSKHGFFTIDCPGVVVTTIKRAEDGDDIIVRLLETLGREVQAAVALPFAHFSRAVRTNVVEEGRQELPSDNRSFRIRLAPWSLATVRLGR